MCIPCVKVRSPSSVSMLIRSLYITSVYSCVSLVIDNHFTNHFQLVASKLPIYFKKIIFKLSTADKYRNTIVGSFLGERIITFFEKIRFAPHKTEFLNFCFLAKN